MKELQEEIPYILVYTILLPELSIPDKQSFLPYNCMRIKETPETKDDEGKGYCHHHLPV